MTKDDPNKSVTRLLLNKTQFSRVIGKGGTCFSQLLKIRPIEIERAAILGQTIAHIRSATGVFMKGADIDEEWRLVSKYMEGLKSLSYCLDASRFF